MNKHSDNSLKRIKEFFAKEPDAEEMSWMVLNNFYHYLLTWMENNNVSKAGLARILGKSRATVTKMFLHNPNISIKKIVEITHPLGLDIKLGIEQVPESLSIQKSECETESIVVTLKTTSVGIQYFPQIHWVPPKRVEISEDWPILPSEITLVTKKNNQSEETPEGIDLSTLTNISKIKEGAYA